MALKEVYDRYGDNSFDAVVLAEDESCLVVNYPRSYP